jgi:3-oxoacyl-[acyl-carrier-protein] synthase-3
LIFQAANQALRSAELKANDLDLIITSAVPGDAVTPETACVVRGLLEADCPAFDVRMACTGWIAGVQTALFHICYGGLKRVLVAASTVLSWEKNWGNPVHRTIFGDAAAAVVLERYEEDREPWFIRLWTGATEEEGRNTIYFRGPWSIFPPVVPVNWPGNFYMARRDFYFNAVEKYVGGLVDEVFKASNCSADDVDVAIVHWPSQDLCQKGIEVSRVPQDRVITGLDAAVGNIIAAEMPFKLNQGISSGTIKKGNRVLMVTYGSGFTVGIMLFTF